MSSAVCCWTTPRPVSNESQRGHQLMPSLTYAGGRLMLIYYDVRETRSQSFTQYIDDKTAFDAADFRNLVPRFSEENRKANLGFIA